MSRTNSALTSSNNRKKLCVPNLVKKVNLDTFLSEKLKFGRSIEVRLKITFRGNITLF